MAAVPVSFFRTHRASHQATKSEPMENVRTRGRALAYDMRLLSSSGEFGGGDYQEFVTCDW